MMRRKMMKITMRNMVFILMVWPWCLFKGVDSGTQIQRDPRREQSGEFSSNNIIFDFQTASSLLESEAANFKDDIKVISSKEALQMIKPQNISPQFLWQSNSFTSLLVTIKQLIRIIHKATSSINLFASGGLQGHGESVLNPLWRVQCQRGPWDLQKPGIKSGGGPTIYYSQLCLNIW